MTGAVKTIVGVGDMALSNSTGDLIVTVGLGSCLGITIYDPVARVGGLLHIMLPSSKVNPEKAQARPAVFADTGVPLFFKQAYAMGATKERLIVKVAGGAQVLSAGQYFAIGKRNMVALKKMFWKNRVMISGEDVGGSSARSVCLHMDTGKVFVRSNKERNEL